MPKMAQRRSRGIALLIFNLGARWALVVNSTPMPFVTAGKNPVPIVRSVKQKPSGL
jgi:catalase